LVERRSPKPDAGGSSPSWPVLINRISKLERIQRFLKEVVAELRKVTWPTKEELIGSTIVTIVVSLIVSLFIFVVDRTLTFAIKTIFSGGVGG
jgi:preprotein translocase subunit SecE